MKIPYVGMIVKNIDADDDVPYRGTGRVASVEGASFTVNWRGITTSHGNYPLRFLGNGRILPAKASDEQAINNQAGEAVAYPYKGQRVRNCGYPTAPEGELGTVTVVATRIYRVHWDCHGYDEAYGYDESWMTGKIVPAETVPPDTVTVSQKVPHAGQRVTPKNGFIVRHGTVTAVYEDRDSFFILWDQESKSERYHLSHWREGTFRPAVSEVQAPASDEPPEPGLYGVCDSQDGIVDWRPDQENAEAMARLQARDEPGSNPHYVVKAVACYTTPDNPEPERTDLENPDE